MRRSRTVTAVLAFCLVGLALLTPASSAHSAAAPSAMVRGASVEMAALPGRRVKFEFKQQDSSSYKFYGKVQGAKQKKVILVRATSKEGKYRPFRTGRTNARGHYSWSHLRAVGWFYLKVPGDRHYATSYSKLIHVHYR